MHLRFPQGFLWGAATAAYQIEGSPLADGAGISIWHRFSHTPGNTHAGDTGDIACDHYRRYRGDVALMRNLGLGAYRFSVAWPRVMPEGHGRINEAGIGFYDRLVDALLDESITPFITLYHWDLPAALQDKGGWCNRDSAGWFADYAGVVFTRLGDRVQHWITFNEPKVIALLAHIGGPYAPGMRDLYAGLLASHHILLAHGRAVAAHRARGGGGEIGITVDPEPQQPASPHPDDVAAAERASAYNNRIWLDPIFLGRYPEVLERWFGEAWPAVREGDLREIRAPIDFIGLNYYTRAVLAYAPGEGPLHARQVRQASPHTLMGWEVYPEGLYEILQWIHRAYGGPAMYITENGAAYEDQVVNGTVADDARLDYLRAHLAQIPRALRAGVNVRGYFVWSLLDNFQWSQGYSRRFGIVHVDFATQRRTVKKSGLWYRDAIAQNGF